MSEFCILRFEKLKTDGNVAASLDHALRNRETPNAKPGIHNPTFMYGFDDEKMTREQMKNMTPESLKNLVMKRYRKRLPEAPKKDSVRVIEALVTLSPEKAQKMPQKAVLDYFTKSMRWLENKFGAENVILGKIHLDETTPHLSVFIVPVEEKFVQKRRLSEAEKIEAQNGKQFGSVKRVLNAKKWLGGPDKLAELQTDFAENVGKEFGLQRGVEHSPARHTDIRTWYGQQASNNEKARKFDWIHSKDFSVKIDGQSVKPGMPIDQAFAQLYRKNKKMKQDLDNVHKALNDKNEVRKLLKHLQERDLNQADNEIDI